MGKSEFSIRRLIQRIPSARLTYLEAHEFPNGKKEFAEKRRHEIIHLRRIVQ